ncbi:photosystem II protein PsbQ [Moorena producens]|nr:photosystem II protein PsbQ [Moorena producens]
MASEQTMMMRSYRSILTVILAMVMTFLVSCGSPSATTAPTYTPEKIAQIQTSATRVLELREKMPVLEANIQDENWVDVSSFIHGPLGDLGLSSNYLSGQLLPKDQKAAKEAAEELLKSLVKIDEASVERNSQLALKNYEAALKNFDDFLELIPTS